MSLYARLAAALLIVLAISAAWWKFDRMLAAADRSGYERRAREDKAAADAQAVSNRELSRFAEQRLHALSAVQAKFLTRVTKEIHDAAAPLAACPVPADAVRLLNDAARCARGDSPASCVDGDVVPHAR